MMVGNNLKDQQLQQIVDKTIMYADQDGDGKISFDEFVQVYPHFQYALIAPPLCVGSGPTCTHCLGTRSLLTA